MKGYGKVQNSRDAIDVFGERKGVSPPIQSYSEHILGGLTPAARLEQSGLQKAPIRFQSGIGFGIRASLLSKLHGTAKVGHRMIRQ